MPVQLEFSEGTLTLRLNRPERLNAIDGAMTRKLLDALIGAEHSPEVKVIVLTGAGRSFCAGRDIGEAPTVDILERVQAVSSAIVNGSKPVIAAVHGWAIGAGLEWMMDADIAIAARSARFKLPEASLGVFATGGITALLPLMSGMARAKGMLLLGEEFSAQQAEHWGLLWSVVDDDALPAEAERIARKLASHAPAALGRFKRALNLMGAPNFAAAIELESRMQMELMELGQPHREGRPD